MRARMIAGLSVIVVVAAGLAAHIVFMRTGSPPAMWTAGILLWPAYLIRPVFGGSKRATLAILAIAATLYYAALAAAVVFPRKQIAVAALTAHCAATALIGWMMVQILDVARSMEALQD